MYYPDGIGRYTPTLSGNRKVRAMSVDVALLPFVGEAISDLMTRDTWIADGSSIESVVDSITQSINEWYSDMLIGMVATFICELPSGWLAMDGTTHQSTDYPELVSVIPSTWISGGTFTLPDCNDVFLVGENTVSNLGITEGSNNLTLTVGQLPPHAHDYTIPVSSPVPAEPGPPVPSANVGGIVSTGTAGNGDSIDVRPKRIRVKVGVYAGRG